MTKPRLTIVVGSLVLVAMIAASWFLVLSSRMAQPGEIDAQAAQVAVGTEQTLATVADLEVKKESLPLARPYAEEIAKKFPATAAQPTLLTMVRQAALDAGISEPEISDLTPSVPVLGTAVDGAVTLPEDQVAETPEDPVAEGEAVEPVTPAAPAVPAANPGAVAAMTVTVSVTGSSEQLQRFMKKLEQMDRAYLVNQVTYGGGGDAGALTLSVTGSMFMLPELVDPMAEDEEPVEGETTSADSEQDDAVTTTS